MEGASLLSLEVIYKPQVRRVANVQWESLHSSVLHCTYSTDKYSNLCSKAIIAALFKIIRFKSEKAAADNIYKWAPALILQDIN